MSDFCDLMQIREIDKNHGKSPSDLSSQSFYTIFHLKELLSSSVLNFEDFNIKKIESVIPYIIKGLDFYKEEPIFLIQLLSTLVNITSLEQGAQSLMDYSNIINDLLHYMNVYFGPKPEEIQVFKNVTWILSHIAVEQAEYA